MNGSAGLPQSKNLKPGQNMSKEFALNSKKATAALAAGPAAHTATPTLPNGSKNQQNLKLNFSIHAPKTLLNFRQRPPR